MKQFSNRRIPIYQKKYYEFILLSKNRYAARLELVEAALKHGIKPVVLKDVQGYRW